MKRSDRFKKFKEISVGLENNAGDELAAAQSQLEVQKKQLHELKEYLGEYKIQLQTKLDNSDSALVINGYQQFISSLNGAITIQNEIVRKSEITTEELRKSWLEKKLEVSKLNQAVDNIRSQEDAIDKKAEQSENDERVLNNYHRKKSLSDLEAAS